MATVICTSCKTLIGGTNLHRPVRVLHRCSMVELCETSSFAIIAKGNVIEGIEAKW